MHRRIVLIDGVYELVLAAFLLIALALGRLDGSDLPEPGAGVPVALFAIALIPFGVVLIGLARADRVSPAILLGLATVNGAFAAGLGVWAAADDGFSTLGALTVWSTVAVLAALAATQLAIRARGLPGAPRTSRSGAA